MKFLLVDTIDLFVYIGDILDTIRLQEGKGGGCSTGGGGGGVRHQQGQRDGQNPQLS